MQKDIFALFGGVGTPTITQALPTVKMHYEKKGIFYFSNFTGAQIQRRAPYAKAVFNVRASYDQETEKLVQAYLEAGKRRIGMFIQYDAYGRSGKQGVEKALQKRNLILAEVATYVRGQEYKQSYAAQVAQLRRNKVDAVIAVGAYQACAGFVRDARTSGWTVPISNLSFVGSDQLLALLKGERKKSRVRVARDVKPAKGPKSPRRPDLLRNLINSQVVPSYNDTSCPIVREYRRSMDKNHPTVPDDATGSYIPKQKYSFGSLEGYLSAKAFITILDRVGMKKLTRESFYNVAETIGEIDLGVNVVGRLSRAKHQVLDHVWLTYATNEGWMPVDPRTKVIF